jgi:hypothetical protein
VSHGMNGLVPRRNEDACRCVGVHVDVDGGVYEGVYR